MAELKYEDIQGFIIKDYGMPAAEYLFYRIDNAVQGRAWLKNMLPSITTGAIWNAAPYNVPALPKVATNVAFTWAGLKALGAAGGKFPFEFKTGMFDRTVQLNDVDEDAPGNWDFGKDDTLHVLVMISAGNFDPKLRAASMTARTQAADAFRLQTKTFSGVVELHSETGDLPASNREHFGFTDGIGQPAVDGFVRVPTDSFTKNKNNVWMPLNAGEFILGQPDEDETGVPPTYIANAELAHNGTFLVFRKLHQRVFDFDAFLKKAAAQVFQSDDPKYVELLAAKLVGRWRSGVPLIVSPDKDIDTIPPGDPRLNDFCYADDPQGNIVPRGAHIRRVNPRDTDMGFDVLMTRHRIIRRGLPYGPELPKDAPKDDGLDRGVIFMALGASIERQYEFIQTEWVNKGDAFGLSLPPPDAERDPVIGANPPNSQFTIPGAPMPATFSIQKFTVVKGGGYFFIPGMNALTGIAEGRFANFGGNVA